jgi:adhesin transport system outer membrane protein
MSVARENIAAADSGVSGARWGFAPTPSISANNALTRDSGSTYGGDKTVSVLGLRQPIWTGGKLTAGLGLAEAQRNAAEADLESTRQQLALRVVQAWSDAIAANETVEAYTSSYLNHERLLKMVTRRAQEGASAESDVHLAQARFDAVHADLLAAKARGTNAVNRLHLLIGRLPHVPRSVNVPPIGKLLMVPDEARIDALLQSPAVARARADISIAQSSIDGARAAVMPNLSLRMERQFGSQSDSGPSADSRVFLDFTTSFGAGLSAVKAIDAAKAKYNAALNNLEVEQLSVSEQVEADLESLAALGPRVQSLKMAVTSNEGVVNSWERQFLAGRKQWQDLMNAARDESGARAQLAEAVGQQQLIGWRLIILTKGVMRSIND